MRLYFVAWMVVLASSVSARPAGAEDNFSTLVRPGPDGRLAYQADAKGNVIPDFSNCGYMGGGVTIPNVPVKATLAPEASGDDTDRIQKAIDTLGKLPSDSAGLRGTLLLKKGRYRVEGQLKITAGGVVLRGEGQGEDGTIVIATGKDKRHLVVAETPKDTARAPRLDEAKQAIVDAYVPVGARSFRVADASAYKPGDTVYVSREGNAEWIHAIHMDQIKPIGADRKLVQWTAFTLQFDRVVTAVNGNRITVDAPLACAIDAKWGGGGIRKFRDGRIGQIGVENIRFESDYDASKTAAKSGSKYEADEEHAIRALAFTNVKNCWARKLTAVHFSDGLVNVGGGTKWMTVQDSSALDMVSVITGGRRYPFCIGGGQLILVQRCSSRDARHAFSFGARVCGPNVFLDCTSEQDHASSEPHHRWSVGGLYDNVKAPMAVVDRGAMGSGHGWSGANYVIWNGEGSLSCEQPPTAQNYAIGFVGKKIAGPNRRADGHWESQGKHVEPRSLYLKQLEDRLGTPAVKNIAQ